MIISIFFWIITEIALVLAGLFSPDIGPGDIYQTIDAIHYFSFGSASLLLLTNLYILIRVPAPPQSQPDESNQLGRTGDCGGLLVGTERGASA